MSNNAITKKCDDIVKHCNQTHSVDAILTRNVDDWIISQQEKEQILDDLLRWFWNNFRDDGSYYIEHLEATLENFIRYFPESINRLSILVALLHDSIEDTDETFETLYEKYWLEVAICVQILSKRSKNDPYLKSPQWRKLEYSIRLGSWKKGIIEFIKWLLLNKKMEGIIGTISLEKLAEVIMQVKLCDRLHNLKTLPEEKKEGQFLDTKALSRLWKYFWWNIQKAIEEELAWIFHEFKIQTQKRIQNTLDTSW